MKNLKTLTLLLIFSFILCGCIEPDSLPENQQPSQSEASAQLCALFDKDTINRLIGKPNQTKQIENLDKNTAGCAFSNTEDEALYVRNIGIVSLTAPDEATSRSNYERATGVWRNSTVSQRTLIDLPDLGTAALWSPGSAVSQLIAYRSTTMIIITFGHLPIDEEQQLKEIRALAEITLNAALPKLGVKEPQAAATGK
ncbi:hypothetical protein KJ951_03600 [Patescibacteria group bacterium]|nr:hypothetical protein [Patescibacteria group bacterium]MBU1703462.1 hypothetical protein [Patescibacteria group bacterium]MBU1953456.1 hypothetical protein [Patescibacteria group bacterium]